MAVSAWLCLSPSFTVYESDRQRQKNRQPVHSDRQKNRQPIHSVRQTQTQKNRQPVHSVKQTQTEEPSACTLSQTDTDRRTISLYTQSDRQTDRRTVSLYTCNEWHSFHARVGRFSPFLYLRSVAIAVILFWLQLVVFVSPCFLGSRIPRDYRFPRAPLFLCSERKSS